LEKDLTDCTPNNLLPPESYEDRLPQAQAMASATVKQNLEQRLWWAMYGDVLALLLCLILIAVFILLLRGAMKNR